MARNHPSSANSTRPSAVLKKKSGNTPVLARHNNPTGRRSIAMWLSFLDNCSKVSKSATPSHYPFILLAARCWLPVGQQQCCSVRKAPWASPALAGPSSAARRAPPRHCTPARDRPPAECSDFSSINHFDPPLNTKKALHPISEVSEPNGALAWPLSWVTGLAAVWLGIRDRQVLSR